MSNLFIDPKLLCEKAHLQPKMHVADFGTDRNGHLVFPASSIVGEEGIVYAVDIQKPILEVLHKQAALQGLMNIHTVWSDLEKGKTAIPEGSLDAVFLVNTLSFAGSFEKILLEAKRLLKDKARIVIVDWKKKMNAALGPKDECVIDFSEIKKWAKAQGFLVQEEFGMGKFHHGLVLFWHST